MSNPYIFATNSGCLCLIPISLRPNGGDLKYVETMNSVGLNNLSLKYQRFMTLGCEDLGIRKSEFVAKTQVLCYFTPFIIK